MSGCSCAPDTNERLLPILTAARSVPSLRVQDYLNWHPPIFPRGLYLRVLLIGLFISFPLVIMLCFIFFLECKKRINE